VRERGPGLLRSYEELCRNLGWWMVNPTKVATKDATKAEGAGGFRAWS